MMFRKSKEMAMADDYSPAAISLRLARAARVYRNRGDYEQAEEAELASSDAARVSPELAREIEVEFNRGHEDYSGFDPVDPIEAPEPPIEVPVVPIEGPGGAGPGGGAAGPGGGGGPIHVPPGDRGDEEEPE
jgi:hypothetical protein